MINDLSEPIIIPLKKGIWFTGGYDNMVGSRLATTEIMNNDGTIIPGPNLPSPRSLHCQVSHKNLIFIIGKC